LEHRFGEGGAFGVDGLPRAAEMVDKGAYIFVR